MMCPRCGHRFVCGCGADGCQKRAKGRIPWRWIDGDVEACGVCGLEAGADQWMDEEYAQLGNGRNVWPKRDHVSLRIYLGRPGRGRLGDQLSGDLCQNL